MAIDMRKIIKSFHSSSGSGKGFVSKSGRLDYKRKKGEPRLMIKLRRAEFDE